MDQERQYDAIIIGSGQAGGPLSTALVAAGRKTALIERIHIGGTCINDGCTPTKTMVASARIAYLAGRSGDFGIETGPESIDMPAVRRRKQAMVDEFRNGSTRSIRQGGAEIIMGDASFTSAKSVLVRLPDGAKLGLQAETIFINTGARPAVPPISGLDTVPYLDSTTIMELGEVPAHLLVLGGGYVGLEFSQMYRRFGSAVTIVQMGPHLLAREDDDVADAVAGILREDGIEILLNASATAVSPAAGTTMELTVKTENGLTTLAGSHLLIAAGRSPNTGDLNLEAAGVEKDSRGFVKTSGRLETSTPGIYAMGDVSGSAQFTHISYDDFRILRDNLLHGGNRDRSDRLVPYTMFIDPQLGRVGITESQARQAGRSIKVARMPMSSVARALEVSESRGFMKAVVDAETGQILGCAVLGLEGGEIMAMMEIAMMGKLPYTALLDGIFAHPTLAESLNTLFGSFEG